MKKDQSMKVALSNSLKSFLAAVIVTLASVVTGVFSVNAAPTASAPPSPYVGKDGPKRLMEEHWAQLRDSKPTTLFDALDTPLANTNEREITRNSQLRSNLAITPLTVDSTVQTMDYTSPTESSIYPTNVDPVWSPDTSYLIFSSNRGGNGHFHLYALVSSGESKTVIQLTDGAGNERWPSLASDTQIAYCVSDPATGLYSLVTADIDDTGATLSINPNTVSDISTGVNDVEHPSWAGDTIAFAGRKSANSSYHIYYYTVSGNETTELTSGPADDENPSVSPIDGLVSFDSNASSFSYSSTVPGPAVSTGVQTYRNVFVTRLSGANTLRLTTASNVNSIESTWSYVPPGLVLPTGYYIWFSSNRVNGHYGIYYVYVVPQSTGGAVAYPEGTVVSSGISNPAQALLTSDPVGSEPVGGFNNYQPAVPQFQQNFYNIAYVSPRFIVNNIYDNPVDSADAPAYDTPNAEPTNSEPSTPGSFNPSDTSLNPTGSFEILASRLFDIDPPALLRYSTSEIIHTLNSTDQPTRTVASGSTVRFLVRLSERQAGVGQVYLQIKDPDSKYEDAAGLEHKVFTHPLESNAFPGEDPSPPLADPTNPTQFLHSDVDEATTLYAGEASVGGNVSSGQVSDIGLGQLLAYVPPGLASPPATAIINATSFSGSTVLSLKGVEALGNATGPDGFTYPLVFFSHLAGSILQLYDSGHNPTEKVQVVSATFDLSGTPPIVATLVITPVQDSYVAPSGGVAGYASVAEVGEFDPMGSEVDCEAVEAGEATQTDATDPNSYVIPPYTPGVDDATPLQGTGTHNPSAPNGLLWLPLTPVPATDALFDKSGGVLYEATWLTPSTPSDYYIDVVAFSNVENNAYIPENLNSITGGEIYFGQNWRIYDNIWGFSTQPFITHTTPSGVLIVNDYMLPQKFFNSQRFGSVSLSNVPSSYFGAESYITDIDTNWYDTKGNLAFLPSSAYIPLNAAGTSETISQTFHRPTGSFDIGLSNTPYYPNGLGVNSYIDDDQTNVIPGDSAPPFPLLDDVIGTFNGQSAYADDFDYHNDGIANENSVLPRVTTIPPLLAPSQKYDIWRILSRGPLPSSILAAYAPQVITQPANVLAGTPSQKVLVANSCVLWCSPFAGDEFADNGTIVDELNTQPELSSFVSAGGRLFVEGIDVGFALTSNGAATNSFYSSVLNANFLIDDLNAVPATLTLAGSGSQTDYISNDAYTNNSGSNFVSSDVGHNEFKLANTEPINVSPNWSYEPPYKGALNLASFTDIVGETTNRSDASLNDGGDVNFNSSVAFIDGFSNLLSQPSVNGPLPITPVEATELKGSGASDQLVYTAFTPAISVAATSTTPAVYELGGGIAAYSSFGLESVSQEVTPITPLRPVTPAAPDYTVFSVESQRTDLLHNLICFLRTGTLTGQVTSTDGGTPQPNTEVVATPEATGGFTPGTISYTSLTNSNGVYSIAGVPAGRYTLAAYEVGTSFQHANGAVVDTHGGDTGVLNLQVTPVPPGNLAVNVINATTDQPLPGATVSAVQYLPAGSTLTPVVLPTEQTQIINLPPNSSTATASFANAPGATYIVTVSDAGFTTVTTMEPTTSVPKPTYPNPTVTPGLTTTITIKLAQGTGTLTATVISAATGLPIGGASVTLTSTSSTTVTALTGTTDKTGVATVTGIPIGTYSIVVAAGGYLAQKIPSLSVAANQAITLTFKLVVAPTGVIYGLVSRSYDGAAIPNATVTLTNTSLGSTATTTTQATTFTAPDGKPANYKFSGVAYSTTGSYSVSVSAPGYPPIASQGKIPVSSATGTRVDFSAAAIHSFPAGLQLISIPYDYTSSGDTLSQIFGYSNPKFAYWEPALDQYAVTPTSPTDTIHIGLGYWVRFPAPTGLLIQGTPASTPTTKSAATVTFSLSTGWNMIGDPFTTDFTISSLVIEDGAGNNFTFANAASAQLQLINPTLYTYNQTTNSYSVATTSLVPYKGYWIEAFSPVTLKYTLPQLASAVPRN